MAGVASLIRLRFCLDGCEGKRKGKDVNDLSLRLVLRVEKTQRRKCVFESCSLLSCVRLTSGRMCLYRTPFCAIHARLQLALLFGELTGLSSSASPACDIPETGGSETLSFLLQNPRAALISAGAGSPIGGDFSLTSQPAAAHKGRRDRETSLLLRPSDASGGLRNSNLGHGADK